MDGRVYRGDWVPGEHEGDGLAGKKLGPEVGNNDVPYLPLSLSLAIVSFKCFVVYIISV